MAFVAAIGPASAPAAEACPNAALMLGPSATLPDCRAYEQVTPVQKGGRSIPVLLESMQASIGGSAFAFSGVGLPGAVGSQDVPTFLARRSAGQWSSQGVLPPQNGPFGAEVLGWNEELTQVYDRERSEFDEAILLRDSASGELRNLTGYREAIYTYDATSADGSKVFFEAHTFGTPLTPEALANGVNLYMWDKSTGRVSLVGLLPGETAPEHGSVGGPYAWEENERGGGGSSGTTPGYEVQQIHAFSADGSRAFFTELESGQLYLRENPGTPLALTLPVSKSHKTNGGGAGGSDPHGPQPAAFMRATADGSVALFTSPEELTNEATTGSEDQGNDLYMFRAETGGVTDLTPDAADANGAEVQGVLGMSEDGSYVYFVANGVLAPGAPLGTCQPSNERPRQLAEKGKCNLYVWHDGTISFISQLFGQQFSGRGDPSDWSVSPAKTGVAEGHQDSRVSSDGRILLFGSVLSLTSYDNIGPAACSAEEPEEGLSGHHCREFYRYDAESRQLTCVTCNPTGDPPGGDATLVPLEEGGEGGAAAPASVLTRNLSSRGDRVFFSSPDQLVSEDVNSRYNGYEWEADGTGSCHSSAQNGGCLFLLTPGDSPRNSYFLDASASGGDAFLLTDRPLVGQDTDQLGDVYDAREGGGIPGQWPATPASCASADECAPSASPLPVDAAPASAMFSGPGNFTPAPAVPAPKGTTKPLTRAQKLARALKACSKKPRRRRAQCKRIARKRYGPSHVSKRRTRR